MNAAIYRNLTLARVDVGIETAEFDGEWMLMNLETHEVTKLNELGGRVWSLLPECPRIDLLAERVASEYDVPVEVAAADIEIFVVSMLEAGLFSVA